MAKFTDADGNEVEVFTKAEVEQIINDRVASVEGKIKPFDESKFGEVVSRIDKVEGYVSSSRVKELGAPFVGGDKEKLKTFTESFNRLSGYEDTEEGQSQRAAAAARLAFGTDVGIDTAALGAGGGRSVDGTPTPQQSASDKAIQDALGISQADVTKYGSNK